MIQYEHKFGWRYLLRLFQLKGSVFPTSFFVALPSATLAFGIKLALDKGALDEVARDSMYKVLNNAGAWAGFSFLVGFLVVFRTSHSYSRFWDGSVHTHRMHSEWFDACSNLVAFCVQSKADSDSTAKFKHLIVRMFSILHVLALAELEDASKHEVQDVSAFRFELIDVHGIDQFTLQRIKESESKVELVFTWIQQLIVANISSGVMAIPPPILSRVFQELSNGMIAFEQAINITLIPFPFPYAQTCDCLLLLHWMVLPTVVAQWATHPFWAFLFTFIQVFILWSLNLISLQLENPFGRAENDFDAALLQTTFNRHLSMLLAKDEDTLPKLLPSAIMDLEVIMCEDTMRSSTIASAWLDLDETNATPTRSGKRRAKKPQYDKVVRRAVSRDLGVGSSREGSQQTTEPRMVSQTNDLDEHTTQRPLLESSQNLSDHAPDRLAIPVLHEPKAKECRFGQEAKCSHLPARTVSPPPRGCDVTNVAPTMFGFNCTDGVWANTASSTGQHDSWVDQSAASIAQSPCDRSQDARLISQPARFSSISNTAGT